VEQPGLEQAGFSLEADIDVQPQLPDCNDASWGVDDSRCTTGKLGLLSKPLWISGTFPFSRSATKSWSRHMRSGLFPGERLCRWTLNSVSLCTAASCSLLYTLSSRWSSLFSMVKSSMILRKSFSPLPSMSGAIVLSRDPVSVWVPSFRCCSSSRYIHPLVELRRKHAGSSSQSQNILASFLRI
jgi:hypothetical protein